MPHLLPIVPLKRAVQFRNEHVRPAPREKKCLSQKGAEVEKPRNKEEEDLELGARAGDAISQARRI